MENDQSNHYDKTWYWNAAEDVCKGYIRDFIAEVEKIGADHSTEQHFFEETLLRKEVMNFLVASSKDSAVEGGRLLNEKAELGINEGEFLPLEYLFRVFQLDTFERFCIMLLAVVQRNPQFHRVFAFLNNDWRRSFPTAEMVIRIYHRAVRIEEEFRVYFYEASKLMKYLLTAREQNNEKEYRWNAECRLREDITEFIEDTGRVNPTRNHLMEYYIPEQQLDPILTKSKPYLNLLSYIKGYREEKAVLFYLYGDRGIGKKLNMKYLAKEMNRSLVIIELEKLETGQIDLQTLVKEAVNEVILRQGLLCIHSRSEDLPEQRCLVGTLEELIDGLKKELPFLFFISDCSRKAAVRCNYMNTITIRLAADSLEEHHRFWMELSKGYEFSKEVIIDEFANKFILSPGQMKEIFEEAKQLARWQREEKISSSLLQRICYEKLEHHLGKKAQKLKLIYKWEDLILPKHQKKLLTMACDQVRYKYKVYSEWGFDGKIAYGTGLSILFSGSPGTGKTMAAQVIAGELGLELYKIELASVVSKFIGETERNLNEIFTEAKKSQAVIFFDEADVLFSKRSEVKDTNDKYSNLEAAFMLQKIEEYTGIVILATNLQQNIDEAFKRRIKFLIDFPMPDELQRKQIWQNVFPVQIPLSGTVDYSFLAKQYELSGSNIRNAAVNAAFIAASEESDVEMKHILWAVANEFNKSGKKLTKEEFGEYHIYSELTDA